MDSLENLKTIEDLYEYNDLVRERLRKRVSTLTKEQEEFVPDGDSWSIKHIVEHLSKVERGMMAISSRLISKASDENLSSDGTARLSDEFLEQLAVSVTAKLNAPEVVQPSGGQSVGGSLASLGDSRRSLNKMRESFESVQGDKLTFPHPYFGKMTAHEWLALIGLHESRHLVQIERILSAQRNAP